MNLCKVINTRRRCGISRWIYYELVANFLLLFIGSYLTSAATSSKAFLTQPKVEPYYVSPGEQNVVLPCSVSGDFSRSSALTLQWIRVDSSGGPRLISLGNTIKMSGYELDTTSCSTTGAPSTVKNDPGSATSATGCYDLRIKQVVFERDNGVFFCQIDKSDEGLEQSNPAKVIVIVPPGQPNITAQPTESVPENRFVEIECQSRGGNPPPRISWLFANGSKVNAVFMRQENASNPQQPTKGWIKLMVSPSENGAIILCRVWNEATTTAGDKLNDAATLPLSVTYAPRVKVGPENPYNVEAGTSVAMSCTADANPPPTSLRWSRNEDFLVGSEGRQSLNFNTEKDQTGVYMCEVDAPGGQGQARIKLNVFYAPEIKIEDQYRRAVGKSITLFCDANALPPANKVSWSGPNGYSSESNTLELKALTLKDMGNYTCQATNELNLTGQGLVTRTTRKSTFLMVDHAPGKASIKPAVEPVVVGSNVNLSCWADDPGSPLASYRWKRPGQQNFSLNDNANNRPSLLIDNVKLTDSGEYACQPYNEIGLGEVGTYYLVVYVPAQIDQGPRANELKNEGDTDLSMTCSATGHPAPNITWLKDDKRISNDDSVDNDKHWSVSQAVDENRSCESNDTCLTKVISTLNWRTSVRWSDKGVYECQAFNGAGPAPANASAVLSVKHKPVIINDPSQPRVATDLKQLAVVSCRVASKPEPSFRWLRDNDELTAGNEVSIETKLLSEADDVYQSDLIFKSVQDQDIGEYVCRATNQLGSSDFKFSLQPKSRPMPTSNIRFMDKSYTSFTVGWKPGFDGGEPQTFVVEITHTTNGQAKLYNISEPSSPLSSSSASPSAPASNLTTTRSKRSVAIEKTADKVYNISGLLPGSEYRIRVKSKNRLGETDWSPSVMAATSDALLDANMTKASEAVYSSDTMTLTFKPTNVDPSAYCLLTYRQLTSGKFSVDNCYSTASGSIEHLKPANNFKVRFCLIHNMLCGPEFDVLTGADSPLTWQIIVAVAASLLVLVLIAVGVLIYCYRNRKGTNSKKASPQISTSSSIIGGRVVNQPAPKAGENDLSGNRRTPSLNNENSPDVEMNSGARQASKDSGIHTSANGSLSTAPVTSSSNPYDLHRYSSEPMDLTPRKDTNYEDSPPVPAHLSGHPLNRAPSYDDHEHWGATDGYGLSHMGGGPRMVANGKSNVINGGAPSSGGGHVTNQLTNVGGGGGDSTENSSAAVVRQLQQRNHDASSVSSEYSNPKRVMKEIIV